MSKIDFNSLDNKTQLDIDMISYGYTVTDKDGKRLNPKEYIYEKEKGIFNRVWGGEGTITVTFKFT